MLSKRLGNRAILLLFTGKYAEAAAYSRVASIVQKVERAIGWGVPSFLLGLYAAGWFDAGTM